MPKEKTPFSLRYTDASPDQIDARDLIHVLSAFARIAVKASGTFYGSDTRTSFRIAHVQSGSIDIQGFVELLAGLQPTFAMLANLSLGVEDIPELIKSWFDLLKFLKGQPPQHIQKVKSGNAVQIKNVEGDVQVVNGNVYNTFIFNNVGRDAAKLEVPTKHGAKNLELYRGRRKIGTYNANDLAQFRPIKPAANPIESEIEVIVEVVAPVLEGEGVWRFKYGRMTLTAKLMDENYREKVQIGQESFRHGDRLRVKLKTIQEKLGDKLSTKHYITKVLERV
jgi:hypothetical protein